MFRRRRYAFGIPVGQPVQGTEPEQQMSAGAVSPAYNQLVRAVLRLQNSGGSPATVAVQGHIVRPGENTVQGHFFADQAQTQETAQVTLLPGQSADITFQKTITNYREDFTGAPSALDVLWSLAYGQTIRVYRTPNVLRLPSKPQPPTAPGAPWRAGTGLEAGGVSAYLDIAWSSVPGATYYQVFHPTDGLIYHGPNTSFRKTGLYPGAGYTVAVKACNSVGCSALGPQATLYCAGWPIPAAPSAPWKNSDSVTCCGAGCASINFGWSHDGYGVTYFEVWHGSEYLGYVDRYTRSFTKSGLYGGSGGANYTVNVVACNPAYKTAGPSATLYIRPCV